MSWLIKLIPNLITVFGLLTTLVNIYLLLTTGLENLWLNLILLNLAILLDFTDGILARKLDATSKFGAITDSVHDLLLYIFLPFAYFYLNFQSEINANILIILAFCFFAFTVHLAAIIRLVRYTQGKGFTDVDGKQKVVGLLVIYNLLLIPLTNLLSIIPSHFSHTIFIVFCINLSVLMPSKVPFPKISPTLQISQLILLNLLTVPSFYALS